MFTVKASYRGETRKLSFSMDGFPSYEQLCKELYRFFPIGHIFYLAKLLFSPDAAQGGRILIGKEVHSAEGYRKSIAPYIGRKWAHGLLRFSVHDHSPHRTPKMTSSYIESAPDSHPGSNLPPMGPGFMSHISSPPTVHSMTSGSSSVIVDGVQMSVQNLSIPGDHVSPDTSNSSQTVTQEVQKLIADFKKDLDRILGMNVGSSTETSSSLHPPFVDQRSALTLNAWNGFRCSRCSQVQYWCCFCLQTRCLYCVEPNLPECYNRLPPHCWVPISPQQAPSQCSDTKLGDEFDRLQRSQTPRAPKAPSQTSETLLFNISDVTTPKASHVSTPQDDVVSGQEQARGFRTSTGGQSSDQVHTDNQHAVIHRGIICDGCEKTITGVRHKCLDCPDYDLCSGCMDSGSAERHDPFHEFYGIVEPGRVVVHTVCQGKTVERVSHYASCDLCDMHIVGDRYKCLQCPDFDTCSSCFRITDAQHPHHSFVRLRCQEDYIQRVRSQQPVHNAICNLCLKRIQGIRFKCMHPDCRDFDLCAACEAHPIPLHPETHPLLKIKTLNAMTPTVYHSSKLYAASYDSKAQAGNGSDSVSRHEHVDNAEHEQSFIWGHMRASSPQSKRPPSTEAPLVPRLDQISPSISLTPIDPSFTSSITHSSRGKDDPVSFLKKMQHDVMGNFIDSLSSDPSVERTGIESCSDLSQLMRSLSIRADAPLSVVDVQGTSSNGDGSTNTAATAKRADKDQKQSATMEQISPQPVTLRSHALAMLLNDYQSVSTNEATPSASSPTLEETRILPRAERSSDLSENNNEGENLQDPANVVTAERVPKKSIPLRATFIEDVTVPDGQVFPPGAEFMKCWRLRNDSEYDWPDSTSLVCVAGALLGFDTEKAVRVGVVHAGATVDIWTSGLKAPNTPGRYVGYWRLRDNENRVFGDSIWIDIAVAAVNDSDESVLSSRVIMPQVPSIRPSAPTSELSIEHVASVSTPASLSIPAENDDSDSDSDISLVSIPTSEDDDLVRDDVVSSLGDRHSQTSEYVLLYDDGSSEDE